MVQLVGLDHIQLAIPPGGEDQARQFYQGLLGLREINKPEPLVARGGCWFEGTGIALHLGVEPGFRPSKKAHPCFRVADLDACRQTLEAAGVATRLDISVPSAHRFYATDPFGNRLEFLQDGDSYF